MISRSPALCMGAMMLLLLGLGACQSVGPGSIGLGRDRYNSILQSTSVEQTMSNIVRVYKHEPPSFLDVTEVDAALSFGGTLSPSISNIGDRFKVAPGQAGAVGAGVQYSETPTIRYQPLLGQALVAQLVTPVSVDALGLMHDLLWNVGPLLDFASEYITLDQRDFYPALNTIIELDGYSAIELAATKSSSSGGKSSPQAGANAATAGSEPVVIQVQQAADLKPKSLSDNDALDIFLRPARQTNDPDGLARYTRVTQLWVRLLRIYGDSQPRFMAPAACAGIGTHGLSMDPAKLSDWDLGINDELATVKSSSDPAVVIAERAALLDQARDCLPSAIELRLMPLPAANSDGSTPNTASGQTRTNNAPPSGRDAGSQVDRAVRAPLIRTYSALGILRAAVERPGPKIEFMTPEAYREVRSEPWNRYLNGLDHYTLLSGDMDSFNCSQDEKDHGDCDSPRPESSLSETEDKLDAWIKSAPAAGLDHYEIGGQDVLQPESLAMNGALGTRRRYLLIVVDNRPPREPTYASYFDGKTWYYIAADDTVSQRNFQLLTLFLTMMAVPPSTQPLSPVINVGG